MQLQIHKTKDLAEEKYDSKHLWIRTESDETPGVYSSRSSGSVLTLSSAALLLSKHLSAAAEVKYCSSKRDFVVVTSTANEKRVFGFWTADWSDRRSTLKVSRWLLRNCYKQYSHFYKFID